MRLILRRSSSVCRLCTCTLIIIYLLFFFSSRRRHTRFDCDWSSDVCSSDLGSEAAACENRNVHGGEEIQPNRKLARIRVLLRRRAVDMNVAGGPSAAQKRLFGVADGNYAG